MQQYWPTLETFADGATTGGPGPYGTSPDAYYSVVPWTSPEGTTGQSLRVAAGVPYDGYQRLISPGVGACAMARNGGQGDDACWILERTTIQTDVEVSLVPALRMAAGAADNQSFRQFGVCAYAGGGTLTGSGADESFGPVSGYFLIETKNASARHRMLLLEVAAGSITVLGSEDVRDTDPIHAAGTAADFFPPRPLRLVVAGNGGSGVNIDCFRTTAAGNETRLFGATISRGTALDPGRCGFGVQSRFTQSSGGQPVGLAEVFKIASDDGSTRYWVDEFRRLQPAAGRDVTDGSRAGRSLASAWIGDGESLERPSSNISFQRVVRRGLTGGSPLDRVELGNSSNGDATAWTGYHLSQHPASEPTQRVKCTMERLNVATTTRCEMGVAIRFQCIAFPTGLIDCRGRFRVPPFKRADYWKHGYSISVVHDTAATPVWSLEVRHFDGFLSENQEAPIIATASLTSLGLAVGTPFDIDVEVSNFDGDRFGQGDFVAISIKVDATVVTPSPNPLLPGVVELDDLLIDTRSVATGEAGGVGFVVIPDALESDDIVAVESFERATPSAVFDGGIEDQATVAASAENASKSGTLNVGLVGDVQEDDVHEPIVHRMESGKIQPITRHARARKVYSVAGTLTDSEWAQVESLFDANGSVTPFDWTHPFTGETLEVAFVEDSLESRIRHTDPQGSVYQVAWSMERVFGTASFNEEQA